MIPAGNTLSNGPLQEIKQPSRTWKLDFEKGRVSGMIDNIEAIKQAVFKILETPRYRHLIYSFDYGNELKALIGKEPLLVKSEMNRRMQEALAQDDRIQRIENADITVNGETITAKFTVITDYGSFEFTREVR